MFNICGVAGIRLHSLGTPWAVNVRRDEQNVWSLHSIELVAADAEIIPRAARQYPQNIRISTKSEEREDFYHFQW